MTKRICLKKQKIFYKSPITTHTHAFFLRVVHSAPVLIHSLFPLPRTSLGLTRLLPWNFPVQNLLFSYILPCKTFQKPL